MGIGSLTPLTGPWSHTMAAHPMTRLAPFLLAMLGLAQPLVAQQNWPYTPVGNPQPPAVSNDSWCRNPIDRFILARLESNRLAPAAAASQEILLRRVYFDLIGLPPSPAERQAFLDDKSPRSYETVVDRLLASPRYAELAARLASAPLTFGAMKAWEGLRVMTRDVCRPFSKGRRTALVDSLFSLQLGYLIGCDTQ